MPQLIDTYTLPAGWTDLKKFLADNGYEDTYGDFVRFSLLNRHAAAIIRVKDSRGEPGVVSGLYFSQNVGRDFGVVYAPDVWIHSSAENNAVDITACNFEG